MHALPSGTSFVLISDQKQTYGFPDVVHNVRKHRVWHAKVLLRLRLFRAVHTHAHAHTHQTRALPPTRVSSVLSTRWCPLRAAPHLRAPHLHVTPSHTHTRTERPR